MRMIKWCSLLLSMMLCHVYCSDSESSWITFCVVLFALCYIHTYIHTICCRHIFSFRQYIFNIIPIYSASLTQMLIHNFSKHCNLALQKYNIIIQLDLKIMWYIDAFIQKQFLKLKYMFWILISLSNISSLQAKHSSKIITLDTFLLINDPHN
jgi:hypothetical protein